MKVPQSWYLEGNSEYALIFYKETGGNHITVKQWKARRIRGTILTEQWLAHGQTHQGKQGTLQNQSVQPIDLQQNGILDLTWKNCVFGVRPGSPNRVPLDAHLVGPPSSNQSGVRHMELYHCQATQHAQNVAERGFDRQQGYRHLQGQDGFIVRDAKK